MKYKTIEFFNPTGNPKLEKYAQGFDMLFQINAYVTKKLGDSHYEKDIRTFERCDLVCPNGCSNKLFYIYTKYFTDEKRKEILHAKCCLCDTPFFVYREISHE